MCIRDRLNDLFYPPPRFSRLRYLPWRLWGALVGRDAWRTFQRSWVGSASTRQRLRTACDQASVRCAAFTLNSDFTGQPRQQPAALAYAAAGLATTAALGAPIMRVTSDCREKSDDMITPGVLERGIDCLLYTSDAADERSSVDLGGRRDIKKKTHRQNDGDGYG